jgi:hypothetical protein
MGWQEQRYRRCQGLRDQDQARRERKKFAHKVNFCGWRRHEDDWTERDRQLDDSRWNAGSESLAKKERRAASARSDGRCFCFCSTWYYSASNGCFCEQVHVAVQRKKNAFHEKKRLAPSQQLVLACPWDLRVS